MEKGTTRGKITQLGICGACGNEFEVHAGKATNTFQYVNVEKTEDEGGHFFYNLCVNCANTVLSVLLDIEGTTID